MRAFIVNPDNTSQFLQVEQPVPVPVGRELLVQVKAVSLNPIDTKVRASRGGRVLGWDAAGIVSAIGPDVRFYRPGDLVYYAGDLKREGTNAELHTVDERIVGRKPHSLDFAQAAAIPLTALTAWEGLYEQLLISERDRDRSLLVINAAGGVGSLVVQLAKRLSRMKVIGTASRDESSAWTRKQGADLVINHRGDMAAQLKQHGLDQVDYIYCCHDTATHFEAMAAMIAPQGRIVSIVESKDIPVNKLMGKKATFSWELMFTKALYTTPDLASQRDILNRVADLLDEGVLTGTLTEDAGPISAEALAQAHVRQQSASMIGKLALRF
jgi:zinc-binding alcohol dehydrogenase family protein